MLSPLISFHSHPKLDLVLKCLLAMVVTCLLGPITITIRDGMPITLQTLVILFFAIGFGWRIGGFTAIVYVVLGGLGLPVFSGYASGWDRVVGPNAGFFLGFVVAALVCGYLSGLKIFQRPLAIVALWILGHGIILSLGLFWLSRSDETWSQKLFVLFPGALIKVGLGSLGIGLLHRFLVSRARRRASA